MSCDIEWGGSLEPYVPNINLKKELTEKQLEYKINKCIRKMNRAYKYIMVDVFSEDRYKHFNDKCQEIIINEFGYLNYKTNKNETLLHLFVSDPDLVYKTSPRLYKIIIEMLLDFGIDPNIKDNLGRNFILKAIDVRYGTSIIRSYIELGLKHNFNINDRDNEGNTIMGKLLYGNYSTDLSYTYKFLLNKGFNINNREQYDKSFEETIYYITNVLNKNIPERILLLNHYKEEIFTEEYFNHFHKEKENIKVKEEIKINVKDLKFIKRYGTLLNNENVPYSVELPTEIEDKIINNLSSNKMTLLRYDIPYITNDIIYSLPKMIKKYNKDKLNNRLILKTSFKEIINNCSTIGSFKGDFILLMRTCAENKVILVIDNIDKIILENMPNNDKEELNAFIEFYINTKDLILIGRANNEYFDKFNKFFNYNIIDIITKEKPKILKKTK